MYLGFPNKEKYRVYIPSITHEELASAEGDTGTYDKLAKRLLRIVFREELMNPHSVCCTPSEGRTLLNQEYLKGIRCKYK